MAVYDDRYTLYAMNLVGRPTKTCSMHTSFGPTTHNVQLPICVLTSLACTFGVRFYRMCCKNDSDRPPLARTMPIAYPLQERFRSPIICKSDSDRLSFARTISIACHLQERFRSPVICHLQERSRSPIICKGDPDRQSFARTIPIAHV